MSVSVRPEAGAVAIRVADTGEGIPLYAQKHIFDRFYQVEPGSNRSRGGTGLGLSIAKQLVELQGGRIGVQSAPGAGTTITFTLQPVEALPPEGAAAPIPAAPAPAEPE